MVKEAEEAAHTFDTEGEAQMAHESVTGGLGDAGTDIVAFHSRPADAHGRHALVSLAPVQGGYTADVTRREFALPALAWVTLEHVETLAQQEGGAGRLFHVSVTY